MQGRTASAIAASLERAIADGLLGAGERLPTVRALAAELRVSPVTAAAAYRELRQRGLVAGHSRQGTRVRTLPTSPYLTWSPVPEGVHNLALANPDPAFLPSLADALRAVPTEALPYGGSPDLPELLDVVGEGLRGEGVEARELAVVSGALDAVERVLTLACRPGDRVVVEDPCFPRVLDLARALGLELVPVPLDDRGLLPAPLARALERSPRAVVATPRAHNPTGAHIDHRRAEELRSVLARHPDVMVVEDDYAAPIAGVALQTLTASRRRWAHVRSYSKVLGPDLRVAFLAGDADTVERVRTRQRLGAGWVSRILQRIVLELLRDEEVGEQVARAAATYAQRRESLLAALRERGVRAGGSSGMNVWVPVVDEDAVVRALFDAGFAVSAGERFRIESPSGVRITAASLGESEAAKVASAVASATRSGQRD